VSKKEKTIRDLVKIKEKRKLSLGKFNIILLKP
jgi:hypothetical protein